MTTSLSKIVFFFFFLNITAISSCDELPPQPSSDTIIIPYKNKIYNINEHYLNKLVCSQKNKEMYMEAGNKKKIKIGCSVDLLF